MNSYKENLGGFVATVYGNGMAVEIRRKNRSFFAQGDDADMFMDIVENRPRGYTNTLAEYLDAVGTDDATTPRSSGKQGG